MRVVFESSWQTLHDGWSIASRAYARAMRLGGLDARLAPSEPREELDEHVDREIPLSMRVPIQWEWDAHLFSCPLGSAEGHRKYRTFEMFRRQYQYWQTKPARLFYTMFERLNVEPELVAELNALDGVMVPCFANYSVLREAGCENVRWVPYPYFDDDPFLRLDRPREGRRFLWVGRWEPRKAPHNLIRAFLRAFRPGEAKLTLKIGPVPWDKSEYPEPERVIASEVEQSTFWRLSSAIEDITVVRGRLSAREMLGLHADSDVYVTASRGEGIELGSFVSKLAGRRLVITDCGGPVDFLGDNDFLVPATGSIEAPDYAWLWGEGARYADYRLDDLVVQMQRARGAPMREERLRSIHRAENVGRMIRQWMGSHAIRTEGR